jgi:hypothetical protein
MSAHPLRSNRVHVNSMTQGTIVVPRRACQPLCCLLIGNSNEFCPPATRPTLVLVWCLGEDVFKGPFPSSGPLTWIKPYFSKERLNSLSAFIKICKEYMNCTCHNPPSSASIQPGMLSSFPQ